MADSFFWPEHKSIETEIFELEHDVKNTFAPDAPLCNKVKLLTACSYDVRLIGRLGSYVQDPIYLVSAHRDLKAFLYQLLSLKARSVRLYEKTNLDVNNKAAADRLDFIKSSIMLAIQPVLDLQALIEAEGLYAKQLSLVDDHDSLEQLPQEFAVEVLDDLHEAALMTRVKKIQALLRGLI